jgi:hypothetical protein
LKLIQSSSNVLGLHLNLKKCELWWPSGDGKFGSFPEEIIRVQTPGVALLGGALGTEEFMNSVLKKRMLQAKKIMDLLPNLDDAQKELLLLRSCLGYVRMAFALRTLKPSSNLAAVTEFDTILHKALEKILCGSVPEQAFNQAGLGLKVGGLGLSHAKTHHPAAYIGSALQCHRLVQKILKVDDLVEIHGMDEAFAELNKLLDEPVSREDFEGCTKITKMIQTLVDESSLKKQFEHFQSNTRELARMNAISDTLASRWLMVRPDQRLGLHLSSDCFRISVKRLLGISLFSGNDKCSSCHKEPMDSFGDHAVICAQHGDRIRRHNKLRDVVHYAAQAGGLCSRLELSGLFAEDKSKPADVFIEDWSRGRGACLDITVVSPLQKSLIKMAAEKPGVGAALGESRKDSKFAEKCERMNLDFLPLAFESFGRWGEQGEEVLRQIARCISNRSSISFSKSFFQLSGQVAIALQRGNAILLLERTRVIPSRGWSNEV